MTVATPPQIVLTTSLILTFGFGCTSGESEGEEQSAQTATPVNFGDLSPQAPPETGQWGQLVGVWDCVISTPNAEGEAELSRATWTWRYILDGHAIQDVYVGHRAAGPPDFYGTGLRIYHPGTQSWEISWIANSPATQEVSRVTLFTATFEDDEIVMKRSNDPQWRTVFYDIQEASFAWRSEPSGQRMTCNRQVT